MVDWDSIKCNGWPQKEKGYIRILSIDGGGIKGIFPASFLAKIEEDTGKSIHEFFDLVIGTSTGGIIALALSLGIPAKKIEELYVKHGKEIFKPRLFGRLPSFLGILFRSRYKNDNLKRLLIEIFGKSKIKDAKTLLCIPAIEHHKAKPKVYKTPHNHRFHRDADEYMWKIALATSAAPTYFPAACVDNECKIDGGLWANNPVMVGIMEAKFNGYEPERIKLLSLGTGTKIYGVPNKIAEKSGILTWNQNLIELIMNVQTESAKNMASYVGCNIIERIDFEIKGNMKLDSVKSETINELLHEADESFAHTYKSQKNIKELFFK